MKPVKYWLAACLFMAIAPFSYGQKKIKEGIAEFKITAMNLPPEMEAMKAMMPSGVKVYFDPDNSRAETEAMGGKVIVLTDNKKEEVTTLMDLMGKKIAIKTSIADMRKSGKESMPEYEVKSTGETKEIAGYTCKKSVVTFKTGEVKTIEVYSTDDIQGYESQKIFDGVDGFMMEFSILQSGMQMKYEVTSIKSESVDKGLFSVPDGYEEMTQEELMNSFQGGGE